MAKNNLTKKMESVQLTVTILVTIQVASYMSYGTHWIQWHSQLNQVGRHNLTADCFNRIFYRFIRVYCFSYLGHRDKKHWEGRTQLYVGRAQVSPGLPLATSLVNLYYEMTPVFIAIKLQLVWYIEIIMKGFVTIYSYSQLNNLSFRL